jgi:putative hemolysin
VIGSPRLAALRRCLHELDLEIVPAGSEQPDPDNAAKSCDHFGILKVAHHYVQHVVGTDAMLRQTLNSRRIANIVQSAMTCARLQECLVTLPWRKTFN